MSGSLRESVPPAGRRNFRAAYLDHLGFKSIRHSFESALNESIIDVIHLKKLCAKFESPSALRPAIWKLLLGIYSPHRESWAFIDEQNAAKFADLQMASNLINPTLSSENQTKDWKPATQPAVVIPPSRQLAHMVRVFQYCNAVSLEEDVPEDLEKFFAALLTVFDNHVDVINSSFHILRLRENRNQFVVKKILRLVKLLENAEPELWRGLQHKDVQVEQIFKRWFFSVFACLVPHKALPALLERIMSTGPEMMSFIAFQVLVHLKPKLMTQAVDPKAIRAILLSEFLSIEPILAKATEAFSAAGAEGATSPTPAPNRVHAESDSFIST